MKLVASQFSGINKEGDFNWMVNQEKYQNSFFIFNDNYEYFKTSRIGLGNAVMRKYNKYSNLDFPRSAGIITGSIIYKGFQSLNNYSKSWIDVSFNDLEILLSMHDYDYVFFSSNNEGLLATSIFSIGMDVRMYITNLIYSLKNFEKIDEN